jgi:hypothetical protein
MAQSSDIFDPGFLTYLKAFVDVHHSLYPTVPPQGIYFEALVEKAFRETNKPLAAVETGGVNQPRYDISFEGHRISLKTETGLGTKRGLINITKLCTTERDSWDAPTLTARVMEHLRRYDTILMLRAVWDKDRMSYQLVDIPISLLRLLANVNPQPVGKRVGRRSLGADVTQNSEVAFHVHFDGSDGKCQIRNLRLADCKLLLQWEKLRERAVLTPTPEDPET